LKAKKSVCDILRERKSYFKGFSGIADVNQFFQTKAKAKINVIK
jgi:hypothetical protein